MGFSNGDRNRKNMSIERMVSGLNLSGNSNNHMIS